MPIATPEIYNEMLDKAKEGGYAFPAINCTSSETTASSRSPPVAPSSAPVCP